MGSTDRYRKVTDLPAAIPVFPLAGALLLPRCQLPLNIFEPRYLKMVDDALRGNRIIGLVQPDGEAAIAASQDPDAKPALAKIGCAGRLTSYVETQDDRTLITLTGIARFRIAGELDATTPYRQCNVEWDEFADDLTPEAVWRDVAEALLIANGEQAKEIRELTLTNLVIKARERFRKGEADAGNALLQRALSIDPGHAQAKAMAARAKAGAFG